MRILLAGASGMLGRQLHPLLDNNGHIVTALSSKSLDLSGDIRGLEGIIANHDVCINAAAYTQVDLAETHYDLAASVNAFAPERISKWCSFYGVKLLHISTDYVFSGYKSGLYEKEDRSSPINIYGQTKLLGETLVQKSNPEAQIIRTSWLYGPGSNSFPAKILSRLKESKDLKIVTDQRSTPTSTRFLSEFLIEMISNHRPGGVYHGVPKGCATWFEFAQFIAADFPSTYIEPANSSDFNSLAERPRNSCLASEEWVTETWQDDWSKTKLAMFQST